MRHEKKLKIMLGSVVVLLCWMLIFWLGRLYQFREDQRLLDIATNASKMSQDKANMLLGMLEKNTEDTP
jgi:hypothetical protein